MLPKVKVNFEDFQLGLVPPIADATAKLGVASAGPLTPQRFTRGTQVAETYTGGPLAGALAVALMQTAPVIGVRVASTVAGVPSAVTKVGTGASVATITGAPTDAYEVTVTITRSGTAAAGNAAATITVNGETSAERAIPANGALVITGTGLTATFGTGTIVAGDTYSLTSTAPAATVSDIAEALESLLATRPDIRYVHVLGIATPALLAAVDAILIERETRNYYIHGLLEARPKNAGESNSDYLAAIETEFTGQTSYRTAIALDGGETYNPLTRRLEDRNSAWKLSAQRGTRPIGEAAYRVRTGPVPAMGKLNFDANLIDSAGRFAALRTFDGRDGVYVAQWPILAPLLSDYGEVQRREVIDRAATLGYIAAMEALGDDIAVDVATGRILETEALSFEAFVAGRVRAGIGANASGIRVVLNREINILSTETLEFTLSVIPLGYATRINVLVGFLNPMLAAESAAAPVTADTAGATP